MNNENTIWKLINDLKLKKDITEIIFNGTDNVYIERKGEMIQLNTELNSEDFIPFCQEVAKMNKANFGPNSPIVDGVLPDGSRINIISSTYTQGAPAITIRKYLSGITSFDELGGKFGLSDKWIRLFKSLVKAKKNIIVAGGTNAGKTTFLNLMMNEIFPNERVITIEDTRELKTTLKNRVSLVAGHNRSQITSPLQINDLIKNSLRMRPDRIIIGEIRGGEAFDLLQAMNTGHDGSMSSIHANSPHETLSRLETLFTFAGHDIPIRAIRKQMAMSIDFIVQLGKSRDGKRIVKSVAEVSGMEGDVVLLQELGSESDNGPIFTGLVPKSVSELIEFGLDENFFADI